MRSQKSPRHTPVQSGSVRLLSSHHIPTHTITKPKLTQQHRKNKCGYFSSSQPKQLNTNRHSINSIVGSSVRSVYPGGESILELAVPRRGAEVSSVFLLFLSISTGAHVGHSCKAGTQGSRQGSLLEAIMPMIRSHYCASPPQHSIILSIWDVSFDLLTVEQELDQVPRFCSSEALGVSN